MPARASLLRNSVENMLNIEGWNQCDCIVVITTEPLNYRRSCAEEKHKADAEDPGTKPIRVISDCT